MSLLKAAICILSVLYIPGVAEPAEGSYMYTQCIIHTRSG